MNHRSSLLITVLVGLLAGPALAGYQLTDKDGDQTLVSKGRVKELSGEGAGPQSVFDLGLSRAWMSNPDRRHSSRICIPIGIGVRPSHHPGWLLMSRIRAAMCSCFANSHML